MTLTRRLFGVVAGLLVVAVLFVLFGYGFLLRGYLTAELLEQVLNRALGPASNGLYEVEVGAVEVQAASGSLRASDVVLRAIPDRVDELRAEGALPAVRGEVRMSAITIQGARAWPLLRGRALVAAAIVVEEPRVTLYIAEGGLEGRAAAAGSPDRAGAKTRAMVSRLSRVEIDRISIADAVIEAFIEPEQRSGRVRRVIERLEGLSVELDRVRVDPSGTTVGERVAFADDVRFAIERLVVPLKDDSYTFELRDAMVSTSSGVVNVGRLAYEPRASRAVYLADRRPLGDRVSITTGAVAVEGVEFDRLVADLDLVADKMQIEKLAVDVLTDRHKLKQPRRGRPGMPHDPFRDQSRRIRLDELRVNAGSVRFAERAKGAERPGQIRFDSVTVVARNVTNDPARMSVEKPATARIRALFMRSAPVDIRLRMPLLEPGPTMSYSGRVGALEAGALNEMMAPLVGLSLTRGRVDSVTFDIDVGTERATGVVAAIYRDLEMQLVDKNTGNRSLGQRLKSLAMKLGIRASNVGTPGEPPSVGTIDYEVQGDAAFFKTFWKALEDGLMDLVRK